MNKQIVSVTLFLFISFAIYSQVPTGNSVLVEVSKEKTTVGGKTYYLHTVKKGENIYRISMAYGVKQKDIVIANPETISGNLKEGQILKIPIDPVTPHNIQYIESDNFIYHITEEQQTVFSITQKYKITQEELVKYNPELEFSALQVGQVIRIPKKENVSENAESYRPIDNYAEHKVRRRETKYSIAKEYEITVDELIAANPELNTQDLKAGSYIRIPVKSNTQIETKSLIDHKDSLVSISLNARPLEVVPCNKEYVPFSGHFNIALLLPFSLDDNEARTKLDSAAMANNKDMHIVPELLSRTLYSLEFYEGFLLAVDSMKRAGLSVNIYPYDTGKDVAKVTGILAKPEFKSMDMVVGPFYNEGLEKVNTYCLDNGIVLVSPIITNNNILADNPNTFQVIPTDSVSISVMLQHIARVKNRKIILVNPSNLKDTAIFKSFKSQLDIDFYGAYKTVSNKNSFTNISAMLTADSVENIIIVPSSDEVSLMPLFARLNLDTKKYKIKVYGLPELASFKSIDPEYMHNLEVHYYSPFYIDYSKPYARKFITKFQGKFNAPPQDFQREGYNFAFLGYDVGIYFLNAMGRQGKAFGNCQMENSNQLHMILDFVRPKPAGGYINRGTQILKFTKDYYIRKVD